MKTTQRFSKFIRSVLVGLPFGDVWPRKVAPPPSPLDGRTAALEILRVYLSELTFYREGETGKGLIPFQVPIAQIHVEMPDNEDDFRELPAIGLVSGSDARSEPVGLGSWIDEHTLDKFGKNTALQIQQRNIETIAIEVLGKTKHERRALREGIQAALSPTEFMAGIRFRMPNYYDQIVTFMVDRTQIIEDGDQAGRARRGMRVLVEMTYLGVVVVNVVPLVPVIAAFVDTIDGTDTIALEYETDRVAEEASEGEPHVPFTDTP